MIAEALMQMGGMILLGWGIRRAGMLKAPLRRELSLLLVNVTTPALILAEVPGAVRGLRWEELGRFILLSALSLLLLLWASQLLFRRSSEETGPLMRAAFPFGNLTFFALPVSGLLYGSRGVLYSMVYSLLHDLLFWVYCPRVLGESRRGPAALFRQPPLPALGAAFLLGAAGRGLPRGIAGLAESAGALTVPLALICLGASLPGPGVFRTYRREILLLTGSKTVLLPGAVLLLLPFTGLDTEEAALLLVHLGAPAAVFLQVLARKYRRKEEPAAGMIGATTLASFALLPLWLAAVKLLVPG